MKFEKHDLEIILKQIRGVTESLRQSLFWSSLFTNRYVKGNNEDISAENDAILEIKKLTSTVSNNFNKNPSLTAFELLKPFISLISCSKVNGPIVNSILDALSVFIQYDILKPELENIGDALNNTVDAVSQCKFDATDKVDDEKVLMKIIKFLTYLYISKVGICLDDDHIWEIINTILIGTYDVGYSTFLRSLSEEELKDIIHHLYKRVSYFYHTNIIMKRNNNNEKIDDEEEEIRKNVPGFETGLKTLNYFIYRINPDAVGGGISEDSLMNVRLLCLELLSIILTQSKELVLNNEEYRNMLNENLPFYLIKIYQNNLAPILFYHALRNIYILLIEYREINKYQIELYFIHIFFKGLNSPESSVQLTTMLDVLYDLFSDNTFIIDLYVNYDCDPKKYPLCELLYQCLSQRATNNYSQSDYSIAIMNRGLECSYNRCKGLKECVTEAIDCTKQHRMTTQMLIDKKNDRKTLQKGISIFNDNPKSGLQFFQDIKLLSNPPSPKEVAELFRYTSGLNKKLIGEYIGTTTNDFNKEVLKEYVKTFDFNNQKLLDNLRMFLECFRLPGEAQQIDAIVQAFSDEVCKNCLEKEFITTSDVAFCLTFSIIMLNTDLHNPNMKPERRMKKAEFIKVNRNYGGGEVKQEKDLPDEFLEDIYNSIACEQICTSDTSSDELRLESYRDQIRTIRKNPQFGQMQMMEYEPLTYISIYDHEMVTSLWKTFDTTYFSIIHETDGLYSLCENGLKMLYQIGSFYKLYTLIDTIITRLCEQTILLSPLDSPTFTSSYIQRVLEFGSNQKAMNSLKLLFCLINSTCMAIQGGWNWIVHILCILYRVNLLPPFIFHMKYDLLMEDERKQFDSILDQANEKEYTGFFSYIFGDYQTTQQDFFEEPILVKWNENSLLDLEVVKLLLVERCIENCHMENVIESITKIGDDCIDYLISALQMEIGVDIRSEDGLRKMSNNAISSIYTIPPTPYFGALLFSEVICNAESHFESLIPAYRNSLIIVLTNTSKLNYTLEGIIESVLTITSVLLFKYKTLTLSFQLYELLANLENEICNKLVIQITRGLARIVKIESFRFSTEKQLSPILTLLEKTSVNPPSSRQCFDILCEMLCYEYTDLNVYGKMIELINYYYRLQGLSVDLIAKSISSIITIVNNLLNSIQSYPQQERDLHINLVNSFLNSLCVCGMDNRLIIKELSIKAFTKILCNENIKHISISLYKEIIEVIIIPLLSNIVTKSKSHSIIKNPILRKLSGEDLTSDEIINGLQLCSKCSKLLSSLLCFRIDELIIREDFSELLVKMLRWYHLLHKVYKNDQDIDTYIEQSYTTMCTIIIDCKLISKEKNDKLIELITNDKLKIDDDNNIDDDNDVNMIKRNSIDKKEDEIKSETNAAQEDNERVNNQKKEEVVEQQQQLETTNNSKEEEVEKEEEERKEEENKQLENVDDIQNENNNENAVIIANDNNQTPEIENHQNENEYNENDNEKETEKEIEVQTPQKTRLPGPIESP